MAHRHNVQARKTGGKVFYAGDDSNVAKEATSTKSHKRGGRAHKKDGGAVTGFKSGGRIDKRARGGGVGKGADKNPFSSAHISHKRGGHVSGK